MGAFLVINVTRAIHIQALPCDPSKNSSEPLARSRAHEGPPMCLCRIMPIPKLASQSGAVDVPTLNPARLDLSQIWSDQLNLLLRRRMKMNEIENKIQEALKTQRRNPDLLEGRWERSARRFPDVAAVGYEFG